MFVFQYICLISMLPTSPRWLFKHVSNSNYCKFTVFDLNMNIWVNLGYFGWPWRHKEYRIFKILKNGHHHWISRPQILSHNKFQILTIIFSKVIGNSMNIWVNLGHFGWPWRHKEYRIFKILKIWRHHWILRPKILSHAEFQIWTIICS